MFLVNGVLNGNKSAVHFKLILDMIFVVLYKYLNCAAIFFFSIRVFFHEHWRLTGQQGKGGDHLLFHSTTSTSSRTFRHLVVTLHVRWLSHILNCTACIYQTATRWDLPPYRITIWLIDDVTLVFVCLRDGLILAFLLQQFETGNRWIRVRIDYHPCITSEPTNQVCQSPLLLPTVTVYYRIILLTILFITSWCQPWYIAIPRA